MWPRTLIGQTVWVNVWRVMNGLTNLLEKTYAKCAGPSASPEAYKVSRGDAKSGLLGFFQRPEDDELEQIARMLALISQRPFPQCGHSNCYLLWYFASNYPAGPNAAKS